jgi:type IV secretion system protein TrbL
VILAFGFPNPVGWVVDKVTGFVGDVATEGFELVIGGLTAWVVDAVVWVVGGVFNFFLDATDPNVQADWFVASDGPYGTTAAIGATLLVGFLLAGITQGALNGDVGGMLRQIGMQLPVSVLGMVGIVTFVQALVRLTDALSSGVLDRFGHNVAEFTTVISSLSLLAGGPASAFVVFLLGLLTVIAGIILVAELVIRSALVYIVVALAPLVFAAQLWPALRGIGRKLLELVVALIVSKLVMAVALAVAASAMVGVGSGAEVTSLPPPEAVAEDPGGSVTQAVGILLAALAAFGIAAFSPLLITKLMPLTEAALVAQGVRGGPMRAAQQGMSLGYYARAGGNRISRVAGGGTAAGAASGAGAGAAPASAGAGAGGGAGAGAVAGGAGGGAAAGPAGAATAAAGSAVRTARQATQRSTDRATASTDRSAASPPRRPSGPRPNGGGGGRGR